MDKPKWLKLSASLDRISKIDPRLNEGDRQNIVCRLISTRKVGLRLSLHDGAIIGEGGRFGELDVAIPPHLQRYDLNWPLSRPTEPWAIQGTKRRIALIELREDHFQNAIDSESRRFENGDGEELQIREILQQLIDPVRARYGLVADESLGASSRHEHNSPVLAVLDALKARQLKTYDDHERPQDDEDFWIGKTKRELLKRLHHWVRAGEAKKAFPQLCPAITRKVNHGDTAASEPPPSTFESTPVDRMGGPAETREPQGDLPLRGKALTKGLEAWGRSLPELPGRDELYNIARMQPGFAYVTYADIKHLRTKLASETSKRGGAGMHSKRRPKLDKPGK